MSPFVNDEDIERVERNLHESGETICSLRAENLGHAELIRGLEFANDSLRAENARLREALEKVANPGPDNDSETETWLEYPQLVLIAREALEVGK